MGLLWLSTIPPTNALVALMFGTRWLTMLAGFAFFSHQVGGFLGVWLGGVLYERTGSYDVMWWLFILLGIMSALINLPIKEQPVVAAGRGCCVGLQSILLSSFRDGAKRWASGFRVRDCVAPRNDRRGNTVPTFKAIVIDKAESGQTVALKDFDEKDLMEGDVTVRVSNIPPSTTRTASPSPARRRWCAGFR